jgi:hypothetical protein
MYVTVYDTKVCCLKHDNNCGTFPNAMRLVHKQVYEMPSENCTKDYYNFPSRLFLPRMSDYNCAAVGVFVCFEISIKMRQIVFVGISSNL